MSDCSHSSLLFFSRMSFSSWWVGILVQRLVSIASKSANITVLVTMLNSKFRLSLILRFFMYSIDVTR